MVKDKTLRRRKVPKKRSFQKGGQVEFKSILDSYEDNLVAKKELYLSIQNEATVIYDAESSVKNEANRAAANATILALEHLFQDIQTRNTNTQMYIQQTLVTYGIDYTHDFLLLVANIKSVINKITEQLDFARNINTMFQTKKVHLHLIDTYLNKLNTINLNDLNTEFNGLLTQADSIMKSIKDEYSLKQKKIQDETTALEGKSHELASAIGMVNRPLPDGFIMGTPTFIQGCPLGTVLENDQCVYYNDLSGAKTKIESVPLQKTLLNTPSSDYIVWFNKINEVAVGNPTIFKRKELQYIVPLSPEDATLFNAKYVVSEQNGVPKQDYVFIQDIVCCWDQISALLTKEGGGNYYMDTDNVPQPVQIIDHVAPMIRKEEAFTKYLRILDEVDQIITGIQYIETDSCGNVIYGPSFNPVSLLNVAPPPLPSTRYFTVPSSSPSPSPSPSSLPPSFVSNLLAKLPIDISNNIPSDITKIEDMAKSAFGSLIGGDAQAPTQTESVIPFYPDLYDYILTGATFSKTSYNGVDTLKYIILPTNLPPMPAIRPTAVVLDTGLLDPFTYTIVSKFNVNKYVQISTDKYVCPFVLPQVLMNPGDYFLVHNTSKDFPITVIIAKDDKRVLVYPNEIYCFVYTPTSTMLDYGFLSFEKNAVYSRKTKQVSITPAKQYVFVETKPLYENGSYIMQTIEPILDSEKNMILVPNFNQETKSYYDIDDIYETQPILVEIVEPTQVTKDNKTYDSTITATTISKEYLPYKSDFAVLSYLANVFIFSDSDGLPLIDILGYFIPIPSPVFYDGTITYWYSMDKKKTLVLKSTYTGGGTFDDSINVVNNLTTSYASTYQNLPAYTDANSTPILGDVNTLVQVTDPNVTVLPNQITVPNVTAKIFDSVLLQAAISSTIRKNKINVYLQTTDLLIKQYADISGDMNDLFKLRGDLNEQYRASLNMADPLKIYNQVLATATKLQAYVDTQTQIKIAETKMNQVKTERKNELTQIKTILATLETSFETTKRTLDPMKNMNLNADYKSLYDTYIKAQKSYAALNNNIDSITDIVTLQTQEKNINILLNSVQILQANLASLLESIQSNQISAASSLLDSKKSSLQGIITSINNEKANVETYNEARKALNPSDDLTLQFNTTYKQIQSIYSDVASDISNNVMETIDTIDPKIERYKSYLQSIQNEEGNLESIVNSMKDAQSTAAQTELTNKKGDLYKKIQDFEITHTSIEHLVESLSNTDQYTTNLREHLLEVTLIKSNISSVTDITALAADSARVDELQQMDNEIQTDLQTMQLNLASAPAPTVGGGKKKKNVKKGTRKLVVRK